MKITGKGKTSTRIIALPPLGGSHEATKFVRQNLTKLHVSAGKTWGHTLKTSDGRFSNFVTQKHSALWHNRLYVNYGDFKQNYNLKFRRNSGLKFRRFPPRVSWCAIYFLKYRPPLPLSFQLSSAVFAQYYDDYAPPPPPPFGLLPTLDLFRMELGQLSNSIEFPMPGSIGDIRTPRFIPLGLFAITSFCGHILGMCLPSVFQPNFFCRQIFYWL